MPPAMRPPLLGVDHGEARIGLAISDPLGLLAHPLETVDARGPNVIEHIAGVARQRGAARIIVGLPIRRDGTEGPAAAKVRAFIAQLQAAASEIPVEAWDEFRSTVDAQAQLHAAGRNIKNSRAVIDQASACVILQDYLAAQPDS